MRRGYLPAESEAAFQQKVEQFAGFNGWRIYHTHRSDRSPAGFPDLVMVRGPRLIFAELKRDDATRRATAADVAARPDWLQLKDVTNSQADWLQALRRVADAMNYSVSVTEAEGLLEPNRIHTEDYRDAAMEVYVWRPGHWERIEAALRR